MKKIATILGFLLVLGMLLSSPISVQADETEGDWKNTDWETFVLSNLTDTQILSLADWLETDADLDTVILVTTTTGDGWVGELWDGVLSKRFQQEPYEFLQVLARKDELTQSRVARGIAYFGFYSQEEIEQFFGSLVLPKPLTETEQSILDEIIRVAEEEVWNIDLPNPKTGDPVGIVMAAMALCCVGAAGLICRRRNNFGI